MPRGYLNKHAVGGYDVCGLHGSVAIGGQASDYDPAGWDTQCTRHVLGEHLPLLTQHTGTSEREKWEHLYEVVMRPWSCIWTEPVPCMAVMMQHLHYSHHRLWWTYYATEYASGRGGSVRAER